MHLHIVPTISIVLVKPLKNRTGSVILLQLLPAKAPCPIVVTEFDIVTVNISVLSLKAFAAILSITFYSNIFFSCQ